MKTVEVSPIVKSKFKQLQYTGREAELYFLENYQEVDEFSLGILEDARLFGDGYDFQIKTGSTYLLIEVKGVRKTYGAFRLTNKEYDRAREYKSNFGLVVVSNLEEIPKMTAVFDPIQNLVLEKKTLSSTQISYHSKALRW